MSRKFVWIFFFVVLALILGLKAVLLDWFVLRPAFELDGKPALILFNKVRGCECELLVYNNAESQMDEWDATVRVIRIDLDLRPDLGRQYDVIRAPSLVLLNAQGQIVWKQDESLSDVSPLELDQVERQVEALLHSP